MTQDRDYLTVRDIQVRHSTACRDWVCGICGGMLVTRFSDELPHWRTVCFQDAAHDDQKFVHHSTWEYLQHRDYFDAAEAREVLEHLPAELQAAILTAE